MCGARWDADGAAFDVSARRVGKLDACRVFGIWNLVATGIC
jgi:hypothetical protein